MRRIIAALLGLALIPAAVALQAQQQAPRDPNQYEPAIQKFEDQDRQAPPPKGAIVFTGASSIVRWDLPQSFPDLKVINRGFGGSFMSESARYAPRIVVPSAPRIVVLYPGENDIARGVTAEAVAADFQQFVKNIHGPLPKTRIIAIGLKPTPARWQFMDEMRKANTLIRGYCESQAPCEYVSVEREMLGADGRPRPELFVSDGQHMTPEGYKIWTRLVRPHLN